MKDFTNQKKVNEHAREHAALKSFFVLEPDSGLEWAVSLDLLYKKEFAGNLGSGLDDDIACIFVFEKYLYLEDLCVLCT